MDNILLRFRDTTEFNTINEHNNLIKEHGHVWWGWWKKDSEPARIELLKAFESNVNEYTVYLFDRSVNKFYKAKIEELAYNGSNNSYSPDKQKTPTYYKDAELPLWLKMSEISEVSEHDFLTVFQIVPNVDYTFFTKKDISEELELLRADVHKRLKLKSDYILHLSDIHFGDDFGFPKVSEPKKRPLLDIILDYVKNDLKKKIGLLIVSGDITSRGKSEVLLDEGVEFLNAICEGLALEKDEVIIIPGNHDIPLQSADFMTYKHENLYRSFLKLFYGRDVEPFGIEFFEFPCGQRVDILRIHSVKLRKKEESNYGYVDWFHYKNLLSNYKLNGDIKIAVIHHHLVSTSIEEVLDPSYQYGSISLTVDSGRVIEGLQKNGFNIVLNGHQHIPGITRISRGQKNDSNEIIMNDKTMLTILSAGSAGAKHERLSEELPYNSFSIYTLKSNSIAVEVKYYNPGIEPKRHYLSEISIG